MNWSAKQSGCEVKCGSAKVSLGGVGEPSLVIFWRRRIVPGHFLGGGGKSSLVVFWGRRKRTIPGNLWEEENHPWAFFEEEEIHL